MRSERARLILSEEEHYFHHDRIFLNNPAVMQGMGMAPLVIMATTGRKAFLLAVAVALLLTPTRVLCSLLLRKLRQPLLRAGAYCGIAATVYIAVWLLMRDFFGNDMLTLGLYLPLLVVDPLVVYRHGRVPEPVHKAFSKGLRITLGYGLVLIITGCLREFLSLGTVFDKQVVHMALLPVATSPAGGFLLIGVVFAVWRSIGNAWRRHLEQEAKKKA